MFVPLDHVTPEYDHQVLRELAQQSAGGTHLAIEVGSWAGSTALTLVPYFRRLYCVDTFCGSDRLEPIAQHHNQHIDGVFRVFCHNMGMHLLTKVVPCVGKSLEWAAVWPFSVDFIFIDADHEYESVKADIRAWRPHCRGILCGHDYSTLFPGVVKAVHEEFSEAEIRSSGNVWWVELFEKD